MKTKKEKSDVSVYGMKLHDTIDFGDESLHTTIMRVPGGWIYTFYSNDDTSSSSVFAPYSDEFMDDHPLPIPY